MRNLLRFAPGLGPTPSGRVPSFCKVKETRGLRGGVIKYAAQQIPQNDSEIAAKGHLCMETNKISTTQWQGGIKGDRNTKHSHIALGGPSSIDLPFLQPHHEIVSGLEG